MNPSIQPAVTQLMPDAQRFLCELIRFESTPGREHELMQFCAKEFAKVGRVPLFDAIKNDPDYSTPVPDIKYDGRFNLRLLRRGGGGGRKLLFNAHTDVVPASEGMANAFAPERRTTSASSYRR